MTPSILANQHLRATLSANAHQNNASLKILFSTLNRLDALAHILLSFKLIWLILSVYVTESNFVSEAKVNTLSFFADVQIHSRQLKLSPDNDNRSRLDNDPSLLTLLHLEGHVTQTTLSLVSFVTGWHVFMLIWCLSTTRVSLYYITDYIM